MKKTKDIKYYLSLPYKIEIEYEPEDTTWIASHPELGKGSCYAIGKNIDEALKRLKEEKNFILEYALSEGKKIPEPVFIEEYLPSGQFVIRLPKTLHKKLREQAVKESVSLNQLVVSFLAEQIGIIRLPQKHFTITDSTRMVHEKEQKYSKRKKKNR